MRFLPVAVFFLLLTALVQPAATARAGTPPAVLEQS